MMQITKLRRSSVAPASSHAAIVWLRGINNASDTSTGHNEHTNPREDAPDIVKSTIRVDLFAQQAATALATGRALAGGRRPDLQALRDEEVEYLNKVKAKVAEYGARPSLLGPLGAAAFGALGVASSLAPPKFAAAIAAGVQDALTDTFNEQLREMRESGTAESAGDVRVLVRELRDQERAPEGAPQAPDLVALASQESARKVSPAEGIAAVTKAGTRLLLNIVKKV